VTDSIEWMSWHPTLPAVLAGDRAGLMWLWNAKSGKCAKAYGRHQGAVAAGGFRPDGSELWSAGEDRVLRTWSVRSGEATTTIHGQNFHRAPITAGAWSPSGALIATGDVGGVMKITKFDDTRVLGAMDAGENSIECVSVAVASMGGVATIWSTMDFTVRHALQHPAGLVAVGWHPTRPFVVTAACDGAV
jgi:WD40 repeat protein